MSKLYVTRGLPASGKSTWSKNKAREESDTVIVNRDSIRTMLKGEYKLFPFGGDMENLVNYIEETSIKDGLMQGYNVIIDSTGFRFDKKKFEIIMKINKVDLEIVDFTNVPIRTCIERDSKRESPVGKEVIMKMATKYLPAKLRKEIDPANRNICVCDTRDAGIVQDLFGKYCLHCGYSIK